MESQMDVEASMWTESCTQMTVAPATVLDVGDGEVSLQREGGVASAKLALAYPYQPEAGDVVLVLGADELYVVGVLHGRGRTRLCVSGDLDIRADGILRLEAGREVRVLSPRVAVRADRIETIARSAFERVVSCYRWVREVLETRAGRSRTLVEGQYSVAAERIVERAEKHVKIDGKQIHLG